MTQIVTAKGSIKGHIIHNDGTGILFRDWRGFSRWYELSEIVIDESAR